MGKRLAIPAAVVAVIAIGALAWFVRKDDDGDLICSHPNFQTVSDSGGGRTPEEAADATSILSAATSTKRVLDDGSVVFINGDRTQSVTVVRVDSRSWGGGPGWEIAGGRYCPG